MSDRGLIEIPRRSGQGPLEVALSCCRNPDRLPTGDELVTGLARGLLCLEAVEAAAVLVHPQAPGFMLARGGAAGSSCVVMRGADTDPRRVRAPGRWTEAVWTALQQAPESGFAAGRGPFTPQKGPDPGLALDAQTPWLGRILTVGGEPAMAVLLVPGASAADQDLRAGLRDICLAVEAVLGVWVEAMALRTRLRQVRAESRTLGRINQMQNRFVAMASHEFKTPLTSITAYADILAGRITDEHFPQATEFLDVIRQEADRLLRMINRILDFSRMEYGASLLDLEQVDLEPLVRETVRSLGPGIQGKHLQVQVHAPRDLPQVEIDADLVRQVLVNLVGNAVKYTPAGGSISIEMADQAAMVAVTVADDGPGIPPEDMKRIFREFYRASGTQAQEGTGLGLSIARHIVHLHGGYISVAAGATGGTSFTFLLPKACRFPQPVPGYLARHGSQEDLRSMFTEAVRLVAELCGADQAALLLRDGADQLVTVCALGLEPLAPDPGPVPETAAWTELLDGRDRWGDEAAPDPSVLAPRTDDLPWLRGGPGSQLAAPVTRWDCASGCLVLARSGRGKRFLARDVRQIGILARLVSSCLDNIDGGQTACLGALRTLRQIRRRGIPTATAEALELVADLAERLGLSGDERRAVLVAAVLHDAGMIRLDEDVLGESGRLAEDQRDEVERHVSQGLELVEPLLPGPEVAVIIRHHHERWEGRGYPDGLQGQDIPLGSRLLAVVDAWFALTTDRPYRQGMAPSDALAEIRACAGRQFDPRVVTALELAVRGVQSGAGKTPQPTTNREQ